MKPSRRRLSVSLWSCRSFLDVAGLLFRVTVYLLAVLPWDVIPLLYGATLRHWCAPSCNRQ